jgi:tRNA threonylcarbamoyladenosine biosynthesis protein TsaE
MEYLVKSVEDTQKLAKFLAKFLEEEDVILLDGDLGAGKTTFTQSLAKALGIEEVVNSPTFSIVNEYEFNKGVLYHFDLYRIEEAEELFDIGFEEYFLKEGIIVIEWAEKFIEEIPQPWLKIYITKEDENSRIFQITGIGNKWEMFLEELKKYADSGL